MPENRGFYNKYVVERTDGRDLDTDDLGRSLTFTMEYSRDPFAIPALQAYRDAADEAGGYEELVAMLDGIIEQYG